MIIVGQVQTKDEAIEIQKICEIFVAGLHFQYVSRQNHDWKYSVNDGCLGFAVN